MINQTRHFAVIGLFAAAFAAAASGASLPGGSDPAKARTSAIFMRAEPESRITTRQFEARWSGGLSARGDAAMAASPALEVASR